MPLPVSAVLLDPAMADALYGPAGLAEIAAGSALRAGPAPLADLQAADLADLEVLFTGWGCPPLDAAVLARWPRLRAIFFAGGSIRPWVTPAVWARDLVVVSGYGANAVPVADYTLGAILLALKGAWPAISTQQRTGAYPAPPAAPAGTAAASVGLVGFGAIGRLVRERLRPFDLRVLVHDPGLDPAAARAADVTPAALPELFAAADVVSLHAPALPATTGLVGADLLARLRPGATLLNTARGALLREADLAAVLARRPDLTAVLDVLDPEPPLPSNPLLRMPNVIITPHLAGALGPERRRLGRWVLDEFARWQRGEPLHWRITADRAPLLA